MKKLALICVSDKQGIVEFATTLQEKFKYQILSTGATASVLKNSGLEVIDISLHTSSKEIMDGRLTTLHPIVHGGLLCRRDNPTHLQQAIQSHIELIDLVAVNFHPFEKTTQLKNCTLEKATEAIDIGSPALIRSAAKNFESVTIATEPADYPLILSAVENNTLAALRKQLALKAFQKTAQYDYAIVQYLKSEQDEPDLDAIAGTPKELLLSLKLEKQLQHGENPHQHAALYGSFFSAFEKLQGEELSYNNILDISSATYLIGEFEKPTAAIFHHNNPSSVASSTDIYPAWDLALKNNPYSTCHNVIIFNRTFDELLAKKFSTNHFYETIIAPEFTPESLQILSNKKDVRLLRFKKFFGAETLQEVRSVIGGILLQDRDSKTIDPTKIQVVTNLQPTPEQWTSLLFGWRIAKHVKLNAIVLSKEEHTITIESSSNSYSDILSFALWKAEHRGTSLKSVTLASSGFFSSPQLLEIAAKAGITALIQAGRSKIDAELIATANKLNMAMVFTGLSHFKH